VASSGGAGHLDKDVLLINSGLVGQDTAFKSPPLATLTR